MIHGPAWVVFEENHPSGTRRLLSILSPRRSQHLVVQFMQQLYVDRFASLEDRVAFKKSPFGYAVEPIQDRFCPIVHLGHNPFFVGIRAIDIRLAENALEFTYRIATDTSNPFQPIYEKRIQSIVVDG